MFYSMVIQWGKHKCHYFYTVILKSFVVQRFIGWGNNMGEVLWTVLLGISSGVDRTPV